MLHTGLVIGTSTPATVTPSLLLSESPSHRGFKAKIDGPAEDDALAGARMATSPQSIRSLHRAPNLATLATKVDVVELQTV